MSPRCSNVLASLLATALLGACAAEPAEPAGKAAAPEANAPAATPAKKKSNVKTFSSPVPLGKHVACADLVDPAAFATYLGIEISEVKDQTGKGDATSICAFVRGGTPATAKEQERAFKKNGMKLGVLPGDEVCTVTALCSYPVDLGEFKKKCEAEGNTESQAIGQFACVRQTQRAAEYAYTYRTIDNETECILEVMGGPSVTDESLVQLCTKAALETIGPANITKFQ